MNLVAAKPKDASAIAELGARAFAETFVGREYYTQEIVDGYTANAFAVPKIEAELHDSKNTYHLIYDESSKLVGYSKLVEKKPPECIKNLHAIYLERIYLAKDAKSKGYGSVLLKNCFAIARAKFYPMLWLSVWEFNHEAVEWYYKKGFKKAGSWEWPFESHGKKYVDIDWIFTCETDRR